MVCMNDFIVKKTPEMRNFLTSIVDRTTAELPMNGTTPVSEQEFDMSEFNENDLVKFHKLFFNHAPDLASFFVKNGVDEAAPVSQFMRDALEVLFLVKNLGMPPDTASTPSTPISATSSSAPGMAQLSSIQSMLLVSLLLAY